MTSDHDRPIVPKSQREKGGNDAMTAEPSGPHDIGGLDDGPIDRAEHELTFWEWRVDAMVRLLFKAGVLTDFAELRRAIENLGPHAYDALSYYERWTAAVADLLAEKGIITRDELAARMVDVRRRQATGVTE